jgi:putative hydrolase of the HAD superfamily
MQELRVITMDLDDTLWDVMPVIVRAERATQAWLAEHFPEISKRVPDDLALALRAQVVEEFRDRAHDLTFIRKQTLLAVATRAGYDAATSTLISEEAFSVFDAHRNSLELFPDARPALEKLASRFRLIAVTNGNADLEKIGVDDLFDGFVSARTAGAAKPDPRIFAQAVEVGGHPARQTLHVGDHPEHDVHGARQAGLRAAWVNRDNAPWPARHPAADLEVTDLGVLADFLVPGS